MTTKFTSDSENINENFKYVNGQGERKKGLRKIANSSVHKWIDLQKKHYFPQQIHYIVLSHKSDWAVFTDMICLLIFSYFKGCINLCLSFPLLLGVWPSVNLLLWVIVSIAWLIMWKILPHLKNPPHVILINFDIKSWDHTLYLAAGSSCEAWT